MFRSEVYSKQKNLCMSLRQVDLFWKDEIGRKVGEELLQADLSIAVGITELK